jgi:hypothetical protein
VTAPRREPAEPDPGRRNTGPLVPDPRLSEENLRELQDDLHGFPSLDDYENWRELQDDPYDPYGLLDPDEYGPWRNHGPKFHIVVAQAPGWNPGGPPSLDELLENLARTRETEPDLEAEP